MNTEREKNFYVKLAEVFLYPLKSTLECEKWLMSSFDVSSDFAREVSIQAQNNLIKQGEEAVNKTLDGWERNKEAKADTTKKERPLGKLDIVYLMEVSGRVDASIVSLLPHEDAITYYQEQEQICKRLHARGYLTLHNNKDAITDKASEALNVFEFCQRSDSVGAEADRLRLIIHNSLKDADRLIKYFKARDKEASANAERA